MSRNITEYCTTEPCEQYIRNQQKKTFKNQKSNDLEPEEGVQ